jgi:hypothetical protein
VITRSFFVQLLTWPALKWCESHISLSDRLCIVASRKETKITCVSQLHFSCTTFKDSEVNFEERFESIFYRY